MSSLLVYDPVDLSASEPMTEKKKSSLWCLPQLFQPGLVTKPKNTLVFIDWDDTLCPTSWLTQNIGLGDTSGSRERLESFRPELRAYAKLLKKFLTTCSWYGSVFIVTAAQDGWVEHCCSVYFPSLVPFFTNNRHLYPVYSARSLHGHSSKDPTEWKYNVFYDLFAGYFQGRKVNTLSFGDADFERLALIKLYSRLPPGSYTKTVKFWLKPDIKTVRKELDLLTLNMVNLMKHPGNLDLQVADMRTSQNGHGIQLVSKT